MFSFYTQATCTILFHLLFFLCLFTAQLKKVWSLALALCLTNSSNVKLSEPLTEDVLGPAAEEYRVPHEPQNKEAVPIFAAPQTEQNILKKNVRNWGYENFF